ncbi:MAG TPA: ATP-binding protein, partial [Thermosynechococcaceae cyanobacterium]
GQLNQVFMNILSNAIDALEKYNEERSDAALLANPATITIQTEAIKSEGQGARGEALTNQSLPSSVIIRIRDNGPGISPTHYAKLFDPFFTTKPIGKGTGLGLSISYQIIVDKHHGSLKCISAPGEGAEFWLEIPVRQQTTVK